MWLRGVENEGWPWLLEADPRSECGYEPFGSTWTLCMYVSFVPQYGTSIWLFVKAYLVLLGKSCASPNHLVTRCSDLSHNTLRYGLGVDSKVDHHAEPDHWAFDLCKTRHLQGQVGTAPVEVLGSLLLDFRASKKAPFGHLEYFLRG